jgi:hypothetical protein
MALLLVSFTHRQRHLAHGCRSSGYIPQGFSKERFDCGNDCSLHKRRVTQDKLLALLRWEHLQRHLSAASIHKFQQHPVIGIHLLNCLLYQVSTGSKITRGDAHRPLRHLACQLLCSFRHSKAVEDEHNANHKRFPFIIASI